MTVQNDGTVEVNIGEILEEEESAAVSREEAEKKILKEAGKGYEIERLGLENTRTTCTGQPALLKEVRPDRYGSTQRQERHS